MKMVAVIAGLSLLHPRRTWLLSVLRLGDAGPSVDRIASHAKYLWSFRLESFLFQNTCTGQHRIILVS